MFPIYRRLKMKPWKKKPHKGQKEGNNHAKKSSRAIIGVKPSRGTASSTNTNLISCLKKPDFSTNDSVTDAKKSASDSTRGSRASSAIDSVAGTTATTCGCSAASKRVRFDVVEIRQYERIASDNPCCTSGVPIGIGWKYGDTHRRKINDYERSRGNRKVNLDFVLTRSEREALLLEFDVDARSIVSSTRAALKTKFQRKQTVVNARKFSKLEEVIENTSRRLKKALLPRRLMNHGSDDMLELTPSQIFESEQSGSGETVSILSGDEDTKSKIHVMEPDEDTIEKLMQSTFDFPAVSVCDDGDDDASITDEFTLGATTLGNTSALSPSIMEIEKFYKDLELEMFGEELPSMVGQTLEVPLDAEGRDESLKSIISEGAMFQNEMSIDRDHCSASQMPHLEKFPSPPYRDESQSRFYNENAWGDAQDPPYDYNAFQSSARSTFNQYDFVERNYDQPSFTKDESQRFAREYDQRYNHSMNHPIYPHPPAQHQSFPFSQSGFDPHCTQYTFGYYEQMGSQIDSYRHHRHRRNGSFDSSYDIAKTQNSMQYSEPTSRVQELEQSHFRPQSLPTRVDFSVRRNSDPVGRCARRSSRRSSRDSNSPRVRHMPLHGHLSANQWMDGTDTEFGRNNNAATVTITEGDC